MDSGAKTGAGQNGLYREKCYTESAEERQMAYRLEFQKLGITNQCEEQRSPCWILPAGAKFSIIMLSATASPPIIVVAGGIPDYETGGD